MENTQFSSFYTGIRFTMVSLKHNVKYIISEKYDKPFQQFLTCSCFFIWCNDAKISLLLYQDDHQHLQRGHIFLLHVVANFLFLPFRKYIVCASSRLGSRVSSLFLYLYMLKSSVMTYDESCDFGVTTCS